MVSGLREQVTRHRGTGRLDYAPTQRLQINGSYFWNPAKTTGLLTGNDPKVAPPTSNLSIQGGYQPSNATNLRGQLRADVNPCC